MAAVSQTWRTYKLRYDTVALCSAKPLIMLANKPGIGEEYLHVTSRGVGPVSIVCHLHIRQKLCIAHPRQLQGKTETIYGSHIANHISRIETYLKKKNVTTTLSIPLSAFPSSVRCSKYACSSNLSSQLNCHIALSASFPLAMASTQCSVLSVP